MDEGAEKLSFLEDLLSTEDSNRPPAVLFNCPPLPPPHTPVTEATTCTTMIPKDLLTAAMVPSVQSRSPTHEVAVEVPPVSRGLYYTLTTINGVLDLSSPMSCPAEPHPTLGKSASESSSVDELLKQTNKVTELVVPTAGENFGTMTAIPITVENNYVVPQTELSALPVFEIQEGNNIIISSPAPSTCSASSLNIGSSSSSSSCTTSSQLVQFVPTDLSTSSATTSYQPADQESQLTSPVPSSRASSSMISDVMEEEDLPPSLAKAMQSVNETGSLTPLIKEELRYTIQNKRLLKGEDELVVEPHKQSTFELSPEEEEKRRKRRERNKLAAQKCRGKRRGQMESLEKETHRLEGLNASLKKQMKALHVEREKLTLLLKFHDASADACPRNKKLSTSEEDGFLTGVQQAVALAGSSAAANDMFVMSSSSSDTMDSCSDDIISIGQEEEMEAMNMMVVDGEVVIE